MRSTWSATPSASRSTATTRSIPSTPTAVSGVPSPSVSNPPARSGTRRGFGRRVQDPRLGHPVQPSPDDELATLEVEPAAAWVSEYYPCETVEELGEGRLRIRLRVADRRWLKRLALRLGGHARIVEPVDLADAVRADAAAALAADETV